MAFPEPALAVAPCPAPPVVRALEEVGVAPLVEVEPVVPELEPVPVPAVLPAEAPEVAAPPLVAPVAEVELADVLAPPVDPVWGPMTCSIIAISVCICAPVCSA